MSNVNDSENEIFRLHDYIASEHERIMRLKRMYPPDGGGRAYEARSNIRKAERELKSIFEHRPKPTKEYYLKRIEVLLDKGYTTKETARKINLISISHLIPELSRTVYYENWCADESIGPYMAAHDKEILVWQTGSEFDVLYFSMTNLGRHSRLISSRKFSRKEDAIKHANSLRRRYR